MNVLRGVSAISYLRNIIWFLCEIFTVDSVSVIYRPDQTPNGLFKTQPNDMRCLIYLEFKLFLTTRRASICYVIFSNMLMKHKHQCNIKYVLCNCILILCNKNSLPCNMGVTDNITSAFTGESILLRVRFLLKKYLTVISRNSPGSITGVVWSKLNTVIYIICFSLSV